MSDIESDWEGDDDLGGRPYGGRPYGGRPYGGRPYGGRPYGGRPYGGKPYGGKPYGGKPYGGKPYGGRPYGGRPYGGKLSGADDEGPFDPEEWGDEIAELVCQYSAAIQLGSTLVFGESQVQAPVAGNVVAGYRQPGAAGPAPVPAQQVTLRPGDWLLEVGITVSLGLVAGFAARPDLAAKLKGDLAEALALGVDQAALVGQPAGPGFVGPQGIAQRLLATPAPLAGAAELLQWLRNAAAGVLGNTSARNPAWVLTPAAFNAVSQFVTADGLTLSPAPPGRSLDTYPLLAYDGAGGGTLLGFPFVTARVAPSAGAVGVFFASDWRESLIGLDPSTVTVSVRGAPAVNLAIVSATMPLDCNLRRIPGWPPTFAWF